jgi:hypothetical protein
LIVGGYNNAGGVLARAEVYDPVANIWSSVASLNYPRQLCTMTPLSGENFLASGGSGAVSYPAIAELYSSSSGNWLTNGALATPRQGHAATPLQNGKILVTGGNNYQGALSSAEMYHPATGTWISGGKMNAARGGHTATLLLSGNVLVTGGFDSQAGYLATAEIYTPVDVPVTPIIVAKASRLPSGAFQMTFTNTPGAEFTVVAATNLASPFSTWSALGFPAEVSLGQYQFIDSAATNWPLRYYRIRSP